jgi:hypothetical protein
MSELITLDTGAVIIIRVITGLSPFNLDSKMRFKLSEIRYRLQGHAYDTPFI